LHGNIRITREPAGWLTGQCRSAWRRMSWRPWKLAARPMLWQLAARRMLQPRVVLRM